MNFSKIFNSVKHRTKLVFNKRYRHENKVAMLLERIDKITPVGMRPRRLRKPDFLRTKKDKQWKIR